MKLTLEQAQEIMDKSRGNLNLHRIDITELPEGLVVPGYLSLANCINLTKLPDGLKVGDWLDLHGCTSITGLPEGLKVGGSLFLADCPQITELPQNLKVGWLLYLDANQSVANLQLPQGVRVATID